MAPQLLPCLDGRLKTEGYNYKCTGKSNTLSKGNKHQRQQDDAFTENNVDGFASCDHQKKN